MITNKDGSYNKFRILIISLIFIITISITGIYIFQNIEFPKIETPSWIIPTPTPTPTPTLSIEPAIATLYSNTSNLTYNNFTFNWTYSNYSNITNWTVPLLENNSTLIMYGAGGGGGSSNISYTIIAGGGGSGGMGYTGIMHTNSTYVANTTPTIEPTPEITYNMSQNISAAIGQSFTLFGITNPWMIMILFGLPFIILLFSRNNVSSIIPLMFGFLIVSMFFKLEFWSIIAMVMLIPLLIIIFSDR